MPQHYSMSCMNAPHCGFSPLSWELLARAFEGQLVPLYAVLYNAQVWGISTIIFSQWTTDAIKGLRLVLGEVIGGCL